MEREFLPWPLMTGERQRKEGKCRLEIKKKFFMMEEVRHCNRLPREVLDAPSPGVFKVQGFEQPDLVRNVLARGGKVRIR